MRDLGQRAGELDARRPAADDDEGEPGAARIGVELTFGMLERGEDAAAHRGRVLDGLEPGRDRLPIRVAKVMVAGARSEHQDVIADRAVAEDEPARGRLEIDGLGEDDVRIGLAPQHEAERGRDVARVQAARRHLIEERLEEMEVSPVDQRDRDRSPAERLCHVEAAEAAADDHHAQRALIRLRSHAGSCGWQW